MKKEKMGSMDGPDQDYHIKQMVREFLMAKMKKSGEEAALVDEVKKALARAAKKKL
jgi:hypothetical protein